MSRDLPLDSSQVHRSNWAQTQGKVLPISKKNLPD